MTRDRQIGVINRSWLIGLVLVTGLAVVAALRAGLFDLPTVPSDVTLVASGLDGLRELEKLAEALRSRAPRDTSLPAGARLVCQGLIYVDSGKPQDGLDLLRKVVRLDPDNLVFANAYRLCAFRLRRDFLKQSKQESSPTPTFPDYLAKEPIAFFDTLVKEHPSRETRLSLALAWVDEMLLFPALEIKAPSSVESLRVLDEILRGEDAYYVPALFARGLNHLHRPSRLVWPETDKTPPDAAVRDIGRAVAVGRKFKGGSPRLQATLAIALGDAYVKIGKSGNARSWWQVAQNLSHDAATQDAVRRRYAWRDEEILDRLEEELDRARTALDEPMTDLRIMWDPS